MDPIANQTETNPLVERNVGTIKEVEALLERQKEEVRTMLAGQNEEILAIQEQTAERVRDLLYNRYQADIYEPTPAPEYTESPLPSTGIIPEEESGNEVASNEPYQTQPIQEEPVAPPVEDDNPQQIVRESTPANAYSPEEIQKSTELFNETEKRMQEEEIIRQEEAAWNTLYESLKQGIDIPIPDILKNSARYEDLRAFDNNQTDWDSTQPVVKEDSNGELYVHIWGPNNSKRFPLDPLNLALSQDRRAEFRTNGVMIKYEDPTNNEPPQYFLLTKPRSNVIINQMNNAVTDQLKRNQDAALGPREYF